MSFVIVTGYFHFSNIDPPPFTFEVFALIVIPVNSLLNPIFYSGFYSKIRKFLWDALLRLAREVQRVFSTERSEEENIEMDAVGTQNQNREERKAR